MENIQEYINKLLELEIISRDSIENTIWALFIIIIGIFVSIGIHKLILYLFKKFKIIEFIDRITLDYSLNHSKEDNENSHKAETIFKSNQVKKLETTKKETKRKLSQKIKINIIVAKAISYYVFLLFFRWSISKFGINEVEEFLKDLIDYLPNLFVAVIVGFFGIRFANFVYDVTFHALDLGKQKTAKIIASGGKIIILFFTLMVVLGKIGIGNNITDIILIGFVSMLALAGGLAFGLGGRDIAKEILESFRK